MSYRYSPRVGDILHLTRSAHVRKLIDPKGLLPDRAEIIALDPEILVRDVGDGEAPGALPWTLTLDVFAFYTLVDREMRWPKVGDCVRANHIQGFGPPVDVIAVDKEKGKVCLAFWFPIKEIDEGFVQVNPFSPSENVKILRDGGPPVPLNPYQGDNDDQG